MKSLPVIAIALFTTIGLFSIASQVDRGFDEVSAPAWTPPTESPEQFRDIVDYNIFMPDRAGINARIQQEREPVVTTTEPTERPQIVETTPHDPDASKVLVGIAINADRSRIFIEDRKTGTLEHLDGVGDFSLGRITEITPAQIVYTVEGEERTIAIGQTLTGQAPAAMATPSIPPTNPATPSGTDTPADDGESPPVLSEREALIQRMRAAREAERNASP